MYFEIDDIKRRHSLYYDHYNVHGWIDPPEAFLSWDYGRAVMSALPALAINEYYQLFKSNYGLLKTHYEPPSTLKQVGIYWREVRKMDNFKKALGNRMQYALMIGLFDLGPRITLWRQWTAGLWRSHGTGDVEFWRRILPTVAASALTCWLSVPFEVARAAYYSDRSYPEHLRKGYKSIFNALVRIPREEGPYYLMRSATPICLRNYVSFSFLFYIYDFMLNFWVGLQYHADVPKGPIKAFSIVTAVGAACFASMPWDYGVRWIAEFTPKVDGRHPFDNNYRKAFSYWWYYQQKTQYFHGFPEYFGRNAPWMAITLIIADSLGLFCSWRHDYLSQPGSNTDHTMWL